MRTIFLVALLSLFATQASAARFKVKNCDASAMKDINWAVDFIDGHIDEMLLKADFIPSKYADKIKKKWPKTTVKCSTKKLCKDDGALGFHSSGNNIKLCWDSIRSVNATRCYIVGILMHEKAHAANVPIEKKHNDPNSYSYVRKVDLVYRFDEVAENICDAANRTGSGAVRALFKAGEDCSRDTQCASRNCDRGVCVDSTGKDIIESGSKGKLALGEYCSNDTQCSSNQCGKGVCVCGDDSDCGVDSRCIKRIGKNYCIPTGGLIGDFCKKNSDCGIGKCEKKSCVCKKDKDCRTSFGSNDYRCAKPAFGKNFCQATKLSKGASCSRNSDCKSDKCKKKVCD